MHLRERLQHPAAWWLWGLGLATAASRTLNPLLLALLVAACVLVVADRRDPATRNPLPGFLVIGGVVIVFRLAVTVLIPLLTRLFGYFPWSMFAPGENLPGGVALEWARWCRDPDYLLGDETLPLERYDAFDAPVLSYSIEDDDWGTARAVDAMMRAYPRVTRRHLVPADYGLEKIGHMGFFRPGAEPVWDEVIGWLEEIPNSA